MRRRYVRRRGKIRIVNYAKTAGQWSTDNPILEEGILGIESDTLKMKAGDGKSRWNDLVHLTCRELSTDDVLEAGDRLFLDETKRKELNAILNREVWEEDYIDGKRIGYSSNKGAWKILNISTRTHATSQKHTNYATIDEAWIARESLTYR